MSSEQGPHLWGCERPRVLPASDTPFAGIQVIRWRKRMSSEQGDRVGQSRGGGDATLERDAAPRSLSPTSPTLADPASRGPRPALRGPTCGDVSVRKCRPASETLNTKIIVMTMRRPHEQYSRPQVAPCCR